MDLTCSDFGPDPRHVRIGFDRVMGGLDLPRDLKEDLYNLWLPAIRGGDPRQERDALFIHLGHHGWRWRALDAAAVLFGGGCWLQAWHGWIDRPYDWHAVNPSTKLKLLGGSLAHACSTVRDIENLTEPFTALVYRIGLMTIYPGCPVEAGLIAIHGPTIAVGDHSMLPPYFPGCSVALRAISRHRDV